MEICGPLFSGVKCSLLKRQYSDSRFSRAYRCHFNPVVNGDKLVVEAVNQQRWRSDLSVVVPVSLGPVLPLHDGAQHKGRRAEGLVIPQQAHLSGTLVCKTGPVKRMVPFPKSSTIKKGYGTDLISSCALKCSHKPLHQIALLFVLLEKVPSQERVEAAKYATGQTGKEPVAGPQGSGRTSAEEHHLLDSLGIVVCQVDAERRATEKGQGRV